MRSARALAAMLVSCIAVEERCHAGQCEENEVVFLQHHLGLNENSVKGKSEAIGRTTAVLDGSSESCRDGECAYGVLLCEELLKQGKMLGHGSQIGLYNGGGIRASVPQGEVLREHLEDVHPYGNNITFFKLQGKFIREMVQGALNEHGEGPGKAGNWLQTAGLRFQALYDEDWDIKNINVKSSSGAWDALDDDVQYSVASNTYIMEGNGGRKIASSNLKVEENGPMVIDAMTGFFRENSPVSPPAADGRTTHEKAFAVVGTAGDTLDGEKATCRDRACGWGVLLCDEIKRLGQRSGRGTDIVLYNGGGIRASIPKGPVTLERLLTTHPYGNLISFFKLEGSIVRNLLVDMLAEHGPPGQGESGSFLQLGGLRFKATWTPSSSSWALGSVQVEKGDVASGNWEDLDDSRMYSMATNSYVRFGNGGRAVVSSNAVPMLDDGPSVLEVVSQLFKDYSPVSPPSAEQLDRTCLTQNCSW